MSVSYSMVAPSQFSASRLKKLWYVPVLGLGMALMFARLLVMARLLPVAEFATYSAGLLISSSFLMLACLGVHSILQRQLPVLIVRNRELAGMLLTVQCVVLASACALALSLAALLFESLITGVMATVAWVGILHGLSQQYFLVATTESRSRGDPFRYAKDNLWRSIVLLALGFAVALGAQQAYWVLWTEALASVLLSGLILWKQTRSGPSTRMALFVLAVRRLRFIPWRTAFVLLVFASLTFVMINADRWIAAQMLSPEEFAQYAFAWIVLLVAQSAQVVVNASLYPMIARRYALFGINPAFSLAAKASLGLALFGMLSVMLIEATLGFIVTRWFPSYVGSLALTPVFLIIAVFRFSDFWSTLLIITGREVRLLYLQFLTSVIVLAFWWIFIAHAQVDLNQRHISSFAIMLASSGYLGSMALALWEHRKALRGAPAITD